MLRNLFNFHDPIVCISWGTVAFTALVVIAKIIYMAIKGDE